MQDLFIRTGELLLPDKTVDPTAWACVACDQYTSQPEYWREAEALVGERPSALRLILPEVDLDQASARVPKIQRTMREYLTTGVLHPGVEDGFILVERSTESGVRIGLVALIDLEGYDYHAGSHTPVRATEGTILERIPPRLAVRRGAALELSHVLLLIDDPQKSVLEPLYARRLDLPALYDFPLMMVGGHLRGYAVTRAADIRTLLDAFSQLQARQPGDLFLAVGDGNHSLATAKAYWEEIKPSLSLQRQADHPARFAMVEIENLHEDALVFEPIHRVLYGCEGDALLGDLETYARQNGWTLGDGEDAQRFDMAYAGKTATLSICGSADPLTVGTLQRFLDAWTEKRPGAKLDYVHGDEAALALSRADHTVAFLLPALHKSKLFAAVEKLGSLPRKTFSMGEAHEKRYYMEARKLEQ